MGLKIIHTADWHLGQTFFGYDREVEHEAFLSWLITMLAAEAADVLLIAGDVFDVSTPSAAAQRRFFRFLKEATACNSKLQIIVTAGNHDSAARLEVANPLLEELNTHIVGVVKRTSTGEIDYEKLLIPLKDHTGETAAWCMAVPFLKQGDYPSVEKKAEAAEDESTSSEHSYVAGVTRMYEQLFQTAKKKQQTNHAIIAMGHLHASGAELSDNDRSERVIMGGLESVCTQSFNQGIAYTALGHIHKAQRLGGSDSIRYSGSPLPMSFAEKGYQHQVLCIELSGETLLSVRPLYIPKLVELRRIPATPQPSDIVLEQLSSLPLQSDILDEKLAPFIEVSVLFNEPDPTFAHQVEEALKDKHARLTAISVSYPKKKRDEEALDELTYTHTQQIDPLDMLKKAFQTKYNNEISDELLCLLSETIHEVAYEANTSADLNPSKP